MVLADFSIIKILNAIIQHVTLTEGLLMHLKYSILALYYQNPSKYAMKSHWMLENLTFLSLHISDSFSHLSSSLLTNF